MPPPDSRDAQADPARGGDTPGAAATTAPGAPLATGAPPLPGAPPAEPGRLAGGGRRPRPIFLLVGVVIAAALGVGLFTGVGTPSTPVRPVVGATLPAFSLPRLGGGATVAVPADGGGNGRPAILLFFASWCGPCQREVPALASAYHHQQQEGSRLAKVALVGVDVSDPTASALAFVRKSGVTFPVGADRNATVMNGMFQFTGLPDAVFVDADGRIAAIHQGALTSSVLVSWERKLLKTA